MRSILDTHLTLTLLRQREAAIDRRARELGPALVALRERARERSQEPVTVRLGAPDDEPDLARLAELDSAPLPSAPLLIGERGGRAVAAISLRDGTIIADPFVVAADVVAMLRLRARQLDRPVSRPRRARLAQRLRLQRAG
jgi:hypothetical protein